jgi:preprotein translocase subunit Sss1
MDNKKLIYIAVGVLVIGAIGYAVYMIVKKPKDDETK